jgi:hypothetical protein
MKLRIKFPTRGRSEKFFNVLDKYINYLHDKENYEIIVSCDIDDEDMNTTENINKLKEYKNLKYFFGNNKSKIEAINANMEGDFDIMLLASDDMIPQIEGYDEIIRMNMKLHYPDTDGVLWFFDGYRKDLNTLCILGKKYYDRFGYIYNREYRSFWCDNEFTIVANILNKQTYFDLCIIKHNHPDIFGREYDETYKKNNLFGDDMVFKKRQFNNFDLKI